ncbi:Transposase IS116/IS110/IS902 family protein [Gordonia malaquae]|uniref:IS110 family transposase n=1 Tax=Gordonia malaquae TaxID=410332 RepID=UPI0008963E21|nr:IS110 family transposase [Gordonia malaquae]SEC52550.1 Transposase IS116/IS110/IS902 family protein [Gordonia malaquae]
MLFVGDDWAEDHHDLVVIDNNQKVVARARVPEGPAGITAFTDVIARAALKTVTSDDDLDDDALEVMVGIELNHGPWVQALVAAGYQVFGVDPLQAKRFRESWSNSKTKSDSGDALGLAELVRSRHRTLTTVGADSEGSAAIRILAREHQRAVWDRTRQTNRLRSTLREYHPAIVTIAAKYDLPLHDKTILGLLTLAPTPAAGAAITVRQVLPLLARRHDKDAKAAWIVQALQQPQLPVGPEIVEAYAITVRAATRVISSASSHIAELEEQVNAHFSRHPDAEIYLSQPGIGQVIGARLCGEYGDDSTRFRTAKDRRNFAQTSPLTRQSGKLRIVCARKAGNDWALDAAILQANAAIMHDKYAHAYYRRQRDRGVKHNAALRQLANKLTGILHGCLARHHRYDPAIAWANADLEVPA